MEPLEWVGAVIASVAGGGLVWRAVRAELRGAGDDGAHGTDGKG